MKRLLFIAVPAVVIAVLAVSQPVQPKTVQYTGYSFPYAIYN